MSEGKNGTSLSAHQRLGGVYSNERLLIALAEQIKLPFMQIARRAELGQNDGDQLQTLSDIELNADTALRLIDSYLLGVYLGQTGKAGMQLEPVSVASVLDETAHSLSKLAAQYNCQLELHLSGRYGPVMADRAALTAALASLGAVFIEAQDGAQPDAPTTLKLAAHKSKNGIVAGMFADIEGLSSDMYRRAHALYGRARQPFSIASSSTGAGVFVADSILSHMSTPLHVARHQKLNGLAVTLTLSQQLALI